MLIGAFFFAAPAHPAPPQPPPAQRQNRPEIPDVARQDAICFAYYTVNQGVLKLTAQLYPLKDGETREAALAIKAGDAWTTIAATQVTEEPYNNYRQDKTWTAHFRVEKWNESRTVPYRVTALGGVAAYEGTVRANPVGKREIVVAAFTGNSNQDRRLKPDLIGNLRAQDPDVLFFSGDQVYDHTDHLGAWLLFGRQFGEIIKDRPMISIPDDHDVGQNNLWGAGGKVASAVAGDDGGYFMPVEYVKAVERAQTWHLPDPPDPTPIERGIGVYFTALNWGGVSFAILEDRKFKTGPNGPLQLAPRCAPRPDWVTNPDCDPGPLDLPGLQLLGARQERFLERWGEDWAGADFKVVLSQTIFSYATHISHGNRLLADLDSNGWPQSGRRRAVELMRRCFALHISGDQHLGVVAQYGSRRLARLRLRLLRALDRELLPAPMAAARPGRPRGGRPAPAPRRLHGGPGEQDHDAHLRQPDGLSRAARRSRRQRQRPRCRAFRQADSQDHHGILAPRGGRDPAGGQAVSRLADHDRSAGQLRPQARRLAAGGRGPARHHRSGGAGGG